MDNRLTKELIRAWMKQRQAFRESPPAPEQIRRLVGWTRPQPQTSSHEALREQAAAQKVVA